MGNIWALFRMLDDDDSGVIDIEEFCEGCMRLKGEARSYDLHRLLHDVKRLTKRIHRIESGILHNVACLDELKMHQGRMIDVYSRSQSQFSKRQSCPEEFNLKNAACLPKDAALGMPSCDSF